MEHIQQGVGNDDVIIAESLSWKRKCSRRLVGFLRMTSYIHFRSDLE